MHDAAAKCAASVLPLLASFACCPLSLLHSPQAGAEAPGAALRSVSWRCMAEAGRWATASQCVTAVRPSSSESIVPLPVIRPYTAAL